MGLDNLQHSGLSPSRIAMGCEPLGGTDWGKVDLGLVRKAVRCALDLGVTVFDTADVYGLGEAERELSRALAHERHEAFIVTKFGVRWEEKANGQRADTFRDISPNYLTLAVENSLRRLNVEAIPLYLVHWPDSVTPLCDTLGCLEELRSEGKILNYGLSNFAADEVALAAEIGGISAYQGPYNLLLHGSEKEHVHHEACSRQVATFAYGALAQGLLSGKYRSESVFEKDDRRHRLSHFAESEWERNNRVLSVLEQIADLEGKTMVQCALRWVLDSGLIDTVVVGAKSPKQVHDQFQALNWSLSSSSMKKLNEIAAEL